MKTIHISVSDPYDVIIEEGALAKIGTILEATLGRLCKIAIISDSNVFPLYGNYLAENLKDAGFKVVFYIFPAGEASKNAITYLEILNFLAEQQITRTDAIIALGGGVTGDMAGFAAATYLRGIPYIQVPTTLLAMVDSSVGGKTAIDLPAGKNLVGAFYQPKLVLCDLNTLNTLPENVFRDGCAEIIKYSILYDSKLFSHLKNTGLQFNREKVISRCVELKRDVVAEDEFDKGARQMLNLGHTIGHGVEKQSNFTITHGQAVAIGMSIVSKASNKDVYDELNYLLKKFGLPTSTEFTAKQLFISALSDKKRFGDTVNLIIPNAIGNCCIMPMPVSKLESFIEEGL